MEDLFLGNVAIGRRECYYNDIEGAADRRLPLKLNKNNRLVSQARAVIFCAKSCKQDQQ